VVFNGPTPLHSHCGGPDRRGGDKKSFALLRGSQALEVEGDSEESTASEDEDVSSGVSTAKRAGLSFLDSEYSCHHDMFTPHGLRVVAELCRASSVPESERQQKSFYSFLYFVLNWMARPMEVLVPSECKRKAKLCIQAAPLAYEHVINYHTPKIFAGARERGR